MAVINITDDLLSSGSWQFYLLSQATSIPRHRQKQHQCGKTWQWGERWLIFTERIEGRPSTDTIYHLNSYGLCRLGLGLVYLCAGVVWADTCHRTLCSLQAQLPPHYSHRCPVLDIILFRQLFTGEAVVFFPESLTLPTGLLRTKDRYKDSSWWVHVTQACSQMPVKCTSLGLLRLRATAQWTELFLKTESNSRGSEGTGRFSLSIKRQRCSHLIWNAEEPAT